MPWVPEQLFTVRLRDQLSPGLEVYLRDVDGSANNTSVAVALVIPNDRILVLTRVIARASFSAGVGNSLTRLRITASGPAPTDLIAISDTGTIAVAVNTVRSLEVSCDIWIPAGGRIETDATFATADAGNSISLDAFGLLMPRGNVLAAGA